MFGFGLFDVLIPSRTDLHRLHLFLPNHEIVLFEQRWEKDIKDE